MAVYVTCRQRVAPLVETLILFRFQTQSLGSAIQPASKLQLLVAKLPLMNLPNYGSKFQKMRMIFAPTSTKEAKLWPIAVTENYGSFKAYVMKEFSI